MGFNVNQAVQYSSVRMKAKWVFHCRLHPAIFLGVETCSLTMSFHAFSRVFLSPGSFNPFVLLSVPVLCPNLRYLLSSLVLPFIPGVCADMSLFPL